MLDDYVDRFFGVESLVPIRLNYLVNLVSEFTRRERIQKTKHIIKSLSIRLPIPESNLKVRLLIPPFLNDDDSLHAPKIYVANLHLSYKLASFCMDKNLSGVLAAYAQYKVEYADRFPHEYYDLLQQNKSLLEGYDYNSDSIHICDFIAFAPTGGVIADSTIASVENDILQYNGRHPLYKGYTNKAKAVLKLIRGQVENTKAIILYRPHGETRSNIGDPSQINISDCKLSEIQSIKQCWQDNPSLRYRYMALIAMQLYEAWLGLQVNMLVNFPRIITLK